MHCLIHTHTQTNKQIHARIGALIVLYNTFLKSAQKKEKEKVNCILIIKATHTHTVRCTQIRQMREKINIDVEEEKKRTE